MISLIEMLSSLLTTRMGKVIGLIIFAGALIFFLMSINHRRDRMAKLPVISMLEKIQYMERLDLVTYHSNEILMLGDPDVLERMVEKAASDSARAWNQLNALSMKMEKLKMERESLMYSQLVFEDELTDLQNKVDSLEAGYKAMSEDFDSFMKKLSGLSTAKIKSGFNTDIAAFWKSYQDNESKSPRENEESRKVNKQNAKKDKDRLRVLWIGIKKDRLDNWHQVNELLDEKNRDFKHSTFQKALKEENKELAKLGGLYEEEQSNLRIARTKVNHMLKAMIEARQSYASTLSVKKPKLLAILPAHVNIYLDLKTIKTRILEDSTVQIDIPSIHFDPVEVEIDSSLYYNVSKMRPGVQENENGLYLEVFEQMQLGIEVIQNRVREKAMAAHVKESAVKKAKSYFKGLFNALDYQVDVRFGSSQMTKTVKPQYTSKVELQNIATTHATKYSDQETILIKSSGYMNVSRPKPTHSSPDTLMGIDVSHWNGIIDWPTVATQDIKFAYAKATGGLYFVDPKFSVNWPEMKKVGIPRGAFHFYIAGKDPVKQANFFIEKVGALDKNDLPPMLDLEGTSIKGMTIPNYQRDVHHWLNIVYKHYGVKPIIYCSAPFANEYLKDPKFDQYKLWVAEYTPVSEPLIPITWKSKGWYMWQHSPKGKVKGILGYVDADILITSN